MRHTKRLALLAFLAIAASLASAVPARAAGITSYSIVDLGSTFSNPAVDPSIPFIDDSGNIVGPDGRNRNTGIYQLGTVQDSAPGMQNVTQSYYLYANGGNVNLLPSSMEPPSGGAYGLNSLGQVLGFVGNQPVIFSAATRQIIDPKWAPGQTQAPYLAAFNNLGQIVGNGDQPIFYSSPTAVPIPLMDLLPANSGWTLFTATDINDLGEIVGIGTNPAGQSVVYEMIPEATPEPTTLTILGLGVLLYGGWRSRSRSLQPPVPDETVIM